jgi:hypothetical protein
MDDLIAFLRARLDEAEQDSQTLLMREGQSLVMLRLARERLAEVEAKRRILEEVVPQVDGMDDQINGEWGIGPIAPDKYASVPLLKLLVLPYASHPDCREEWRP